MKYVSNLNSQESREKVMKLKSCDTARSFRCECRQIISNAITAILRISGADYMDASHTKLRQQFIRRDGLPLVSHFHEINYSFVGSGLMYLELRTWYLYDILEIIKITVWEGVAVIQDA